METFDVQLTVNTYGGEAMGRLPDGRAVFVAYAAAGETVRIRLLEQKARYARGELLEILDPAPVRIPPPCPHFAVCGGCHYQHLPYPLQLDIKREIIVDQLRRIASLVEPPVWPVFASPQVYGYRNHVQFHLDALGKPGYHRHRTNEVIPIAACHLPVDVLNTVWPQLDLEAGMDIDRLGLRSGSLGDLQIILESSGITAPELLVEDLPVSVTHISPAGSLVLAGSPVVWMQIHERVFQVSAGSFFQVNLPVAQAMVDWVLESVGDLSGRVVMDLYSGVGLFSAFMAGQARKLVAVESSPSACEDFVANLDEFDNVELYEAPVEAVLSSLDITPQIIIADPPRAGMGKQVIKEIVRLNPEILVYISCDPATMARDGRDLLQSGYALDTLQPFDVFPQTYHIESIGLWRRGNQTPD